MDFNELLNDIAKLEGLHLSSIRPGADIIVEKVDVEQEKIIVQNSSGKIFNRSIIEFQRIWDALISEPAVRVEEVLNGSGSSRNQPETIFANLPYIEWLKISNKKHISFVEKETHPYGTLKQMKNVDALILSSKMNVGTLMKPIVVVSTDNIVFETQQITKQFGVAPKGIIQGVYKYELKNADLYCISQTQFGVPQGSYYELDTKMTQDFIKTINIGDYCLGLFQIGNLNGLMKL